MPQSIRKTNQERSPRLPTAPGLRLSHQHSRHATTASSRAQSVSDPPPHIDRMARPHRQCPVCLLCNLREGVGLVFSPARVIFTGVGILLAAAKDVRASQDTLVDIFERIEGYFRRLEIYTALLPTAEIMHIIVKIMVEVLCILGIATKEIKQGRAKKYVKKLIGRTDLEDALKKLDKLTRGEAQMATAEVLKATHAVDNRVRGVDDRVAAVDDRVAGVADRVTEWPVSTIGSPPSQTWLLLSVSARRESTIKWLVSARKWPVLTAESRPST
ncbi:hypothetical protein BC826DRAFT_547696 [Russula brevipes]|nr:hypothetical protein BC826DRAFT_547696 [Russula brevipes]